MMQLTVQYQSGSEACTHREKYKILRSSRCSEMQFSKCAGICIVLQITRYSELAF